MDQDRLQISPHYFQLADNDMRDAYGSGLGLTVSYNITGNTRTPTCVSLGYTNFSNSVVSGFGYSEYNLDMSMIPVMITRYFSPQVKEDKSKVYFGVGAGLVRISAKVHTDILYGYEASHSETDFAWQLITGMNLGKMAFGEIKYIDGSDVYNTGFSLSIGAKF